MLMVVRPLVRDEYAIQFQSVATTSLSVAPSTDTEIDIRNATMISIQVDTIATSFASDNFDINILTRSEDSATYDTVPYASITGGSSAQVLTNVITPGPAYAKIRLDNNSTSKKAGPLVNIQVSG